jgi:hypothetical protein
MDKKRKYGYRELYRKQLIFIYSELKKARKSKFNSYEIFAGKSLISRTIAFRIEKKYLDKDDVPDMSLSTLIHICMALEIDLNKLFADMKQEIGDYQKEFLNYLDNPDNFRD